MARNVRRTTARVRRGATIVLVAASVSILLMLAALAIDFGRMYMLRVEVKKATDAAALSAAYDMRFDSIPSDSIIARAIAVAHSNKVGANDTVLIPAGAIEPGTWSQDSFHLQSWSTATAVRVSASYRADWILARVFELFSASPVRTRSLAESSVAALGASSSQPCLKPWAIPYSALLRKLGRDPLDTAHVLNSGDIARLATTTDTVTLTGSATLSAFDSLRFSWMDFDNQPSIPQTPPELASALNRCVAAEIKLGSEVEVGGGSWLKAGPNPVTSAMSAICNANGGGSGGGNANSGSGCQTPSLPIPIYSATGGGEFRIRYIGAFRMTAWSIADDGTSSISGYFTSLAARGGGFKPFGGPVKASALVK